jgi:transposase
LIWQRHLFYLYGVDESGNKVLAKAITRKNLAVFLENLPRCRVVMEACATSNYWGRRFMQMGHELSLISPQHVKPFIQSQKNDRNDARGIVEASLRPAMKYVGLKTPYQQDLQSLHRIRQLYVKQKVATSNQIRALLLEYGVYIKPGSVALEAELHASLEDGESEMGLEVRECLKVLYENYVSLKKKIKECDEKIQHLAVRDGTCQRLLKVPGVGPLTSTLFVAMFGNGEHYKNGREAAASIGLVPRQHSTGGRAVLLGITKTGKDDLRTLLVHGARSVMKSLTVREQKGEKLI